MTPPLVFIRHGETDWNVEGRLQGQTDIPLNARGRDQAASVGRALGASVADLAARPFIASPLIRASATARLVRTALGLDADGFSTDARLAEMTFGLWEGSTLADIRRREPAAMKERDAARWTHRPPGGESYVDVAERVSRLLAELTGPTVLISHGGVARAVLALAGGGDPARLLEMHIQQGRALIVEDGSWKWS